MNKEIDICVIGVHHIDGDKEEYVTKARGEYHFVNEKLLLADKKTALIVNRN